MSSNQTVAWKAVILLSFLLGFVSLALWLLSGNLLPVAMSVVFLIFGAGLAVILRRTVRATKH